MRNVTLLTEALFAKKGEAFAKVALPHKADHEQDVALIKEIGARTGCTELQPSIYFLLGNFQ